jgi:hypothetical protein
MSDWNQIGNVIPTRLLEGCEKYATKTAKGLGNAKNKGTTIIKEIKNATPIILGKAKDAYDETVEPSPQMDLFDDQPIKEDYKDFVERVKRESEHE